MTITRRHLLWSALALAGIAGLGLMLRTDAVEVEWAAARRGPMAVTVEADAYARSRSRFVITAPVNGRVERLTLLAGDSVRAGQIVARVAPLPYDMAALEQARARVAAAAAHLAQARRAATQAGRDGERARMVEAAGGLSAQQREAADLATAARVEELRAAEAEARAAGSALRSSGEGAPAIALRSPVRGRVLRVPEISERVTPAGTPLLELGDASDLEIVADLLSADAVRIPPRARVELAAWGGGGDSVIPARVRLVEPVATTRVSALGVDEQRVNVVLDPIAPIATLGDGYRVTARIVLWESPSVLTVPASAVFRDGDAWTTFVIARGRAHARVVEVGHRSDAFVEVRSGLQAGEAVVLFPSDRVRDGTRLTTR